MDTLTTWDCLRIGFGVAVSFTLLFYALRLACWQPQPYQPSARADSSSKPPAATMPQPRAESELTAEAVLKWAEVRNLSPDVYRNISLIVKGEPAGSPTTELPSDFRSLVRHYEWAVRSGTATPNDYRKIETAIKRSLSLYPRAGLEAGSYYTDGRNILGPVGPDTIIQTDEPSKVRRLQL